MGIFAPFSFLEKDLPPAPLAPYTTNLQMWWDFGQSSSYPGTGTTVNDLSSGGTKDGTFDGSGQSFSSTDFDGSLVWGTNSFEIAVSGGLTTTANWTTCMWFKRTDSSGINGLYYAGTGTGTSPKIFLYGGTDGNEGRIQLRFTAGSSNVYNWGWDDGTDLNQWVQLTIVRQSGGALYVAKNDEGLQSTGLSDSGTPSWSNFGATESDRRNGWDGSVATVMCYSEALTDTEITQNYNYFAQRL